MWKRCGMEHRYYGHAKTQMYIIILLITQFNLSRTEFSFNSESVMMTHGKLLAKENLGKR